MKPLRNLAVCAIACALCSGVPAPAQPDAAPAQPQTRPPVQPPQDRMDPKWVESMQRLVKDLTNDNLKLRREIEDLRDQKDFLNRELEECRAVLERQKQNRGVFVIPPDALKVTPPAHANGQVPPNWKPFQFNGATYYMIPLDQGGAAAAQGSPATPEAKVTITLPEAKK